MPQAPATAQDLDARRRRGVRRTALALAVVAVAVYALFMLTGTIGK
ncbi:hypothetical protein [Pseudoluteimonas lycopersici]|nr:hypothetical protein [Lysobacter lycopersici]